ncbi:MAG: hypothetical protein IPJ79_19005 [Bacteroidetes bacterium]|nr:hypothetical protein [Bacteroidota bacterium]
MKEKKTRKGFETVGTIKSKEEWDELDTFWADKTYAERLEAVTFLVHSYIGENWRNAKIDFSVVGNRNANRP